MAWRKGFFRLWLVFAILWVLFIAAANAPDVWREWQAVQEWLADPLQANVQHPLIKAILGQVYDCIGDWCSTPPPMGALHSFLTVGLVPPLALLAFGAALAWAFRGFVARSQ
jgi:hypothetical protein